MTLWKRGGVYWNYFRQDGLLHQLSTGTGSKRQAEKIAQKQKEDANARRFQLVDMDPSLTFGALSARFIASGIARPHHLYHLKILLPFFADILVIRITKAQAEEFRRKRQRGTNVKDATVNRDLSCLRRIINWGVEERLLLANPLGRLRLPPERRTRKVVLSVAEEEKLLAAASPHLKPIVIAALDTGMRRGEIVNQRWEDVDLIRNVLFVSKSKTVGGEAREIPLSDRLGALLRENVREEGLIFTYKGNPIRLLKTTWRTTLRTAGIRRLRFHDMRHTFNTRLMDAGVIQDVRQSLMGHSAGRSINSLYTHVETPAKRQAIAMLEAWVKQQRIGGSNAREAESGAGGERTQAVAQEDASRDSSGAGGETPPGDPGDRGGLEAKAQAACQVRGGEKAI